MIVESIKEDSNTGPHGLVYEVRETLRSGGRERRESAASVKGSPNGKISSSRELLVRASSAAEQARWVTPPCSEKAEMKQFSSNI